MLVDYYCPRIAGFVNMVPRLEDNSLGRGRRGDPVCPECGGDAESHAEAAKWRHTHDFLQAASSLTPDHTTPIGRVRAAVGPVTGGFLGAVDYDDPNTFDVD